MENIISNNLEHFGKLYKEEHLSKWDVKSLESNDWEALKFFFYHSFMRGRNDDLSIKYYNFTVEVLMRFFEIDYTNSLYNKLSSSKNLFITKDIKRIKKGNKNSIKSKEFETIKQKNKLVSLLTSINSKTTKSICLQNDTDLLMVLDTLSFISNSDSQSNIYKYCWRLIQEKKINKSYKELNKLYGVADKISTFYLRDIVLLNNYNIDVDNMEFVFPVDTWVAKIASKLSGQQFVADKAKEIKEYFKLNFQNSNFPLIAAGVWYLGFNSFEIAIDFSIKTKLN